MSRIPLLDPPWPNWFADAMARVMPAGQPPLQLFRAVGTSRRAWDKFAGGSLLDKGPLSLRDREIVILRTCARCGCSYEWGVHAALFATRAGLTPEQLADTAAPAPDPGLWTDPEQTLLATVDALIARKRLSGVEFEALSTHFEPEQMLEIIQLVAFYTGVSMICGTLDIEQEPGTPSLTTGATA
jgi:alkylhydroperoxidase family enzyme